VCGTLVCRLERQMDAPGAEVVRRDVAGYAKQPGGKPCDVAPILAACLPGLLEGPAGEVIDVRVPAEAKTEVVVHARQLLGVDGIPIQLGGGCGLQRWIRGCFLDGHALYTHRAVRLSHLFRRDDQVCRSAAVQDGHERVGGEIADPGGGSLVDGVEPAVEGGAGG